VFVPCCSYSPCPFITLHTTVDASSTFEFFFFFSQSDSPVCRGKSCFCKIRFYGGAPCRNCNPKYGCWTIHVLHV